MAAPVRSRVPGEDDEPAGKIVAVPSEFSYLDDLGILLGDDEPTQADEWLVDGLVAAAVPGAIAGAPKSWKTFLMLHLALCVATGMPALGRFKTRQSRVLVIEREDAAAEVSRRLWRIARGIGVDPRVARGHLFVTATKPFSFDDPAMVERLRRDIAKSGASLVLMDSLRRMHGRDENSSQEMAAVSNVWHDLCSESGAAVVVVHHNRKTPQHGGDEAEAGARMRGSSDLFAFLRHVVDVNHRRQEGISIVQTRGNFEGSADDFAFKLRRFTDDDGKNALAFDFVADVQRAGEEALDARVLKVIAEGPILATDLRAKVGGKTISVSASATRLQLAGKIDRLGQRHPWKLVEKEETP